MMKKTILNILIGILFSLTAVFTIFSLTICNDNFIKKVFQDKNYYTSLRKELINELDKKLKDIPYFIDQESIKKDIDYYIEKKLDPNIRFIGRISVDKAYMIDEKIVDEIYNRHLKFNNIFVKYEINKIIYLVYGITLLLIVITGLLFCNTKNQHQLVAIFLIGFFIIVSLYGFNYLNDFFSTGIIYQIFNRYNYFLLGFAVILLEVSLYKIKKARK